MAHQLVVEWRTSIVHTKRYFAVSAAAIHGQVLLCLKHSKQLWCLHRGHDVDLPGKHCVAQCGCIGDVTKHRSFDRWLCAVVRIISHQCDAAAAVPCFELERASAVCFGGKVGGSCFQNNATALGEVEDEVVVSILQLDHHSARVGCLHGGDVCKLLLLFRKHCGRCWVEHAVETPDHIFRSNCTSIMELGGSQIECKGLAVGRCGESLCQCANNLPVVLHAQQTFINIVQENLGDSGARSARNVEVGWLKAETNRDGVAWCGLRNSRERQGAGYNGCAKQHFEHLFEGCSAGHWALLSRRISTSS